MCIYICIYIHTRRTKALRAVPRTVPGLFPFSAPGTDWSAKTRRQENAQLVKERSVIG